MKRTPLLAGNWKMFGARAAQQELRTLVRGLKLTRPACDVLICPPATLLPILRSIDRDGRVRLGGQTCHAEASGPHTGDISAEMLADAGARYVIVGHSERRAAHGENDPAVAAQVNAAWRAHIEPIVCIGETDAENRAGATVEVLTRQIQGSIPAISAGDSQKALTIAYEPVWAIGTGRTPANDDIERLHKIIKHCLKNRFGEGAETIRVIYGGSVKPENAAAILTLPSVDGALVGGASLKAVDFLAIVRCYTATGHT
jgi:triosephosphate isomerase